MFSKSSPPKISTETLFLYPNILHNCSPDYLCSTLLCFMETNLPRVIVVVAGVEAKTILTLIMVFYYFKKWSSLSIHFSKKKLERIPWFYLTSFLYLIGFKFLFYFQLNNLLGCRYGELFSILHSSLLGNGKIAIACNLLSA